MKTRHSGSTAASSGRRQSKTAIETIRTVLVLQVAITMLAVALSFWLGGLYAAWSAAMGGGINIIVTAYFASRVFSVGPGASAARVARAFYVGEVVKLVLTALLFTLALVWLKAQFLPLILTYMATLLAYWLVLPLNLNTSVRTL
ncbi:MAG TPA: ATP synthase subunit I [Candidatus Competibacteraceae bacterium]|nr:ATP synthase subunit I [Candidatus Competibacteraceae bacterium]